MIMDQIILTDLIERCADLMGRMHKGRKIPSTDNFGAIRRALETHGAELLEDNGGPAGIAVVALGR